MKKNLLLLVMTMWSCGVLFSQDTWVKTFGGNSTEGGTSIVSTPDGGMILTGSTSSNDVDFEGMGNGVIFVIKLNDRGDVVWKKLLGGSCGNGSSITTTSNGELVLTGSTNCNDDGDFVGKGKGSFDIFVMKLSDRGDVLWTKVFGGSKFR
jgi:hypothetical protein